MFALHNGRWGMITGATFVLSGSVLIGLSSFLTFRLHQKVFLHLIPLLSDATVRSLPPTYIPHLKMVLHRLFALVVVGNGSMLASMVRAAISVQYDVEHTEQPLIPREQMPPYQISYSWAGGCLLALSSF